MAHANIRYFPLSWDVLIRCSKLALIRYPHGGVISHYLGMFSLDMGRGFLDGRRVSYFPLSWDVLIRLLNTVNTCSYTESYFPLSWDVLIRS